MYGMNVIVVQPPLVQLNTAYPSGAYLSAFFKDLGFDCRWFDLSEALFSSVFSAKGLERLFDLACPRAVRLAEEAEARGDESTAFELMRYVCNRDLWTGWIDGIVAVLRDGNACNLVRLKQVLKLFPCKRLLSRQGFPQSENHNKKQSGKYNVKAHSPEISVALHSLNLHPGKIHCLYCASASGVSFSNESTPTKGKLR